MARHNMWCIGKIFFAGTALSERVFSHFKWFLLLSRSQDINFFWQVVSFSVKHREWEVWEFINCMLKDVMSTKTVEELCVSWQISFVFGCWLSASVGNLLKFFSCPFKNWVMQVIYHVGKWLEITVYSQLHVWVACDNSTLIFFFYLTLVQNLKKLSFDNMQKGHSINLFLSLLSPKWIRSINISWLMILHGYPIFLLYCFTARVLLNQGFVFY